MEALSGVLELDDMEATEVADMFVQTVVENAPDGAFVTMHGKSWLHYEMATIEEFGPAFVHQLAAAVYKGEIEIMPTQSGVGFRGR